MSATDRSHDPQDSGDDDAPSLLFQTTYCSRAAADIDDAAVERILAAAHERNPRLGITGLLVFGGGLFFQWLEGPRDAVETLMDMIRGDGRHDSVVTLSETEEVRERLFPTWDMELVGAEDIRGVLEDARSGAQDVRSAATLSRMLEHLDDGVLSPLDRG
jgi:hypothetical protein